MLGGADNPNGELPSYITGADIKQIWTGMTGFIHIKIHARFLYQAGVSERELFM